MSIGENNFLKNIYFGNVGYINYKTVMIDPFFFFFFLIRWNGNISYDCKKKNRILKKNYFVIFCVNGRYLSSFKVSEGVICIFGES